MTVSRRSKACSLAARFASGADKGFFMGWKLIVRAGCFPLTLEQVLLRISSFQTEKEP